MLHPLQPFCSPGQGTIDCWDGRASPQGRRRTNIGWSGGPSWLQTCTRVWNCMLKSLVFAIKALCVCFSVQKTGTELRFKGKIILDRLALQSSKCDCSTLLLYCSDISNLCFAATFVSGQTKSMNYFMCRDCNIKCVLKIQCYMPNCFVQQGCVTLAHWCVIRTIRWLLSSQITSQLGTVNN